MSRKRQTDVKSAKSAFTTKSAAKTAKRATVTQKQSRKTISIKKSARKASVERKKALKKFKIKRKDERATSEDNCYHTICFVNEKIIK
jgi:hypothetical protein